MGNRRFNSFIVSHDNVDSWIVYCVLEEMLGVSGLMYNFYIDTRYYPEVITFFNSDENTLSIISEVLLKVLENDVHIEHYKEVI